MDLTKYRPCVGILLLNKEGLVFVGRRRQRKSEQLVRGREWQMPQGGIDEGEDPLAAARRELLEETNIKSTRFLSEAPDWYCYDLPAQASNRVWKGKYLGQRQKWFALSFEGEASEIDVDTPAGDGHPEFDAWRWERMDRLPDLVVPFKRDVYKKVVAAFSHLAKAE
ncbi:MAG: RNA pyrophosphohydrolase [Beijerinckiaceae bacterium]